MAEATGNLVWNKSAEKITNSASKSTKLAAPDENKPEKSRQIINELWSLKS